MTEKFYAKMFSRHLEIIFRAQDSGLTEDIDLDVINRMVKAMGVDD